MSLDLAYWLVTVADDVLPEEPPPPDPIHMKNIGAVGTNRFSQATVVSEMPIVEVELVALETGGSLNLEDGGSLVMD